MIVKNLSHASFDQIVDCFLRAFENYYVEMPTEKSYYAERWRAANVDFKLSYGLYDEGLLVGFIIHAIDHRFEKLTAFNTGTGILPEYRGNRLVKVIYDYALKDLSKNGVSKTVLEVIRENDKAIRSYKSVGFKLCKNYKCFAGKINTPKTQDVVIEKIDLENVLWSQLPNPEYYSWDFQKETILKRNYSYYQVTYRGTLESFFLFDNTNKYLGQFDLFGEVKDAWKRLFEAIDQICGEVRVINVDERLKDKIKWLNHVGLKNTVDQYEMEMDVN